MITDFKIFESENCNFEYRGIQDIKNYIYRGCDVNKLQFGNSKTLIQEIIYYQNDIYNGDSFEEAHNIEDAEAIKLLLANGFTNLDFCDNDGNATALFSAAQNGYFEEDEDFDEEDWIVKILIDAGADWDIPAYDGSYFIEQLSTTELQYIMEHYKDKYKASSDKIIMDRNLNKYKI